MKLGNYTTPSGVKGNVFDVGGWFEMILGVIVFLVAIATGQRIVQKIPANRVLDTAIEPIMTAPAASSPSITVI